VVAFKFAVAPSTSTILPSICKLKRIARRGESGPGRAGSGLGGKSGDGRTFHLSALVAMLLLFLVIVFVLAFTINGSIPEAITSASIISSSIASASGVSSSSSMYDTSSSSANTSTENRITATNRPFKALSKSFLYRDFQDLISELDPTEFDAAIKSKVPSVVVYYAPWCAHCQHFVKTYVDIAKDALAVYRGDQTTTISSTSSINTNTGGAESESRANLRGGNGNGVSTSGTPQTALQFISINCVEYRNTCDAAKIASYPTIKAFNFPRGTSCRLDHYPWSSLTI
jgi:thiol-disulfide isomerase/thioredoxin